jgi:hypothetical protein
MIMMIPAFSQKQKEQPDSLTMKKILVNTTVLVNTLVPDTVKAKKALPDSLIKVIRVQSLRTPGKENFAVFGDFIAVELNDLNSFLALQRSLKKKGAADTLSEVILYLDGNPMRDIPLWNVNMKENRLVFQLDRRSDCLAKYYPYYRFLWSSVHVYASAGFRNGTFLATEGNADKFQLKYIRDWSWLLTLLLIAVLAIVSLILAIKTNLIRIGDYRSKFSLALTQLAFWTLLISGSFLYIWTVTGELPVISGSSLILLGISMATTGGARLIDIQRGTARLPDKSEGFLKDILSDYLGYSVHRTQMFLWTVILGFIFIVDVILKQKMPQFDSSLLELTGISSGAYIGLKTVENVKPKGDA